MQSDEGKTGQGDEAVNEGVKRRNLSNRGTYQQHLTTKELERLAVGTDGGGFSEGRQLNVRGGSCLLRRGTER